MTRMAFDAVNEADAGPKWQMRWQWSWPAYEMWFIDRGGDAGPTRADAEAALARHMPELVPVHAKLTALAGGGDRAARFLATWCPPQYLGGCTIAARADATSVRLVRNYDLSPELNEGLLLRSEWTGRPVMGMVEFLWGLSDGINVAGLAVALAYGGRGDVGPGFGITTILRYVLETCTTVAGALDALARVPSHMAYNIVLADRTGATALAELTSGGGMRVHDAAFAANHQTGPSMPQRPAFTRTYERHSHVRKLFDDGIAPSHLSAAFVVEPLRQNRFDQGFGTLFTAEYDPHAGGLRLMWPDQEWCQSLGDFVEGRREIHFGTIVGAPATPLSALIAIRPYLPPKSASSFDRWLRDAEGTGADWARFGAIFDSYGFHAGSLTPRQGSDQRKCARGY